MKWHIWLLRISSACLEVRTICFTYEEKPQNGCLFGFNRDHFQIYRVHHIETGCFIYWLFILIPEYLLCQRWILRRIDRGETAQSKMQARQRNIFSRSVKFRRSVMSQPPPAALGCGLVRLEADHQALGRGFQRRGVDRWARTRWRWAGSQAPGRMRQNRRDCSSWVLSRPRPATPPLNSRADIVRNLDSQSINLSIYQSINLSIYQGTGNTQNASSSLLDWR